MRGVGGGGKREKGGGGGGGGRQKEKSALEMCSPDWFCRIFATELEDRRLFLTTCRVVGT